ALEARSFMLFKRNDLDAAIAEHDRLIALGWHVAESYYMRRVLKSSKGDLDGAIADFSAVIGMSAQDKGTADKSDAYVARGMTLRRKGDLDGAIADFDAVIGIDPRLAMAYLERAQALEEKGETERAQADYETAVKLQPGLTKLIKKVVSPQVEQARQKAAEQEEASLKTQPKNAGDYLYRGHLLFMRGDADAAIADFSKAIELDPKLSGAYNNRGTAYERKNETDKALADLTKA